MDLFQALSDEEGRLSGLDRRLARIALDDVDFVTNASIGTLAERAGVSPPTVTRFCRRLGCKGFPDFKVKKSLLCGFRCLFGSNPRNHEVENKAANRSSVNTV